MKSLILAAGRGTRINEITKNHKANKIQKSQFFNGKWCA